MFLTSCFTVRLLTFEQIGSYSGPFSKNLYSEPGPKVEMGTEMIILGKVCKYAHLLQLYNNSSAPSHQMIYKFKSLNLGSIWYNPLRSFTVHNTTKYVFRISRWKLKMCLTFQMLMVVYYIKCIFSLLFSEKIHSIVSEFVVHVKTGKTQWHDKYEKKTQLSTMQSSSF